MLLLLAGVFFILVFIWILLLNRLPLLQVWCTGFSRHSARIVLSILPWRNLFFSDMVCFFYGVINNKFWVITVALHLLTVSLCHSWNRIQACQNDGTLAWNALVIIEIFRCSLIFFWPVVVWLAHRHAILYFALPGVSWASTLIGEIVERRRGKHVSTRKFSSSSQTWRSLSGVANKAKKIFPLWQYIIYFCVARLSPF